MSETETTTLKDDSFEHSSTFDVIATSTTSSPSNGVVNVSVKQHHVQSEEVIELSLFTTELVSTVSANLENMIEGHRKSNLKSTESDTTVSTEFETMVEGHRKSKANRKKEIYIVLFLCLPIVLWILVHFGFKIYNN